SDSFASVNSTVLQEVIKHIEQSRPIGACVTVTSAVPLAIFISIKATLREGQTAETAKSDIANIIQSFFNDIAFDGKTTTLSYLKLSELIFKSNTVTDIISYTLNGKNVSMPIGNEEYCSLSEVIVNVS
ncbi:MAG: baseplate J/gp47 family protein, partial [Oscillospiraceae bacterium]